MQKPHFTPAQADAAVRLTNDDAAISKLSAITNGYYRDPFVKLFVSQKPIRRDPLMNRGYYSRVAGIQHLIRAFLEADKRKQIVSLGAGFDTNYFRLAEEGGAPHLYVEVDFPEICNNKCAAIARHKELSQLISRNWETEVKIENGELHGPRYHLLPADLRRIDVLEAALLRSGIDLSLPTLFLSECVLIYLEPEYSSAIIHWAGTKFQTSAFVTYEQCNPNDSFGAMMIQNLKTRGCSLRGITAFPDIAAQRERYNNSGWQQIEILDMNAVYERVLSKEEKVRVHKLEHLDELEEWRMIQSHYFLLWAFRTEDHSAVWKGLGYPK